MRAEYDWLTRVNHSSLMPGSLGNAPDNMWLSHDAELSDDTSVNFQLPQWRSSSEEAWLQIAEFVDEVQDI